MEIEAKFSFCDEGTFWPWRTREDLGSFSLGPMHLSHVVDEYVDSAGRDLQMAGYSCRLRGAGGRVIVTLKSLADASPAGEEGVRRREELEVVLPGGQVEPAAGGSDPSPAWQQPAAWPESEARELALRLLDGEPLRHLTALEQDRWERPVLDGDRTVALLSLDRVSFPGGMAPMFELEVELTADGAEQDLAPIVALLRGDPAFEPVHRSKLQRALQGAAPPPLTLRALLRRSGAGDAVDRRLELAQRLFDRTAPLHHLAADAADPKRLIEVLLRLIDAGHTVDDEQPAAGARDLLLAQPLPDLPEPERQLIAGTLSLLALVERREGSKHAVHLGKKRLRKEPAFAGLTAAAAGAARALTAVLYLAHMLDVAGIDAAAIATLTVTRRRAVLALTGGAAAGGARAAAAVEELWEETFGTKLQLKAVNDSVLPPGLRYDQPLAAAGRAVLAAQFARLQAEEPAIRDGAGVDAIHDARVATRRMRTALRLFRDAYPRREVRSLEKGLKVTTAAFGAVRDLDVLLEAVTAEAGDLPDRSGLNALFHDWQQEGVAARQQLLAHLDSDSWRRWCDRFTTFLAAATASKRGEARLCDSAPALIWKRYGAVRAREGRTAEASLIDLHELRKDAKQLRYALEFFRDLLGGEVSDLIERVVVVQDALGSLHDAAVLRDLLDRRLFSSPEPAPAGLVALLERTLAALTTRRRDFLSLWPEIAGPPFSRDLAAAVAEL